MPIKIDEFVIQAQVIEDNSIDGVENAIGATLPDSIKKEIIDECLEKMKDYLQREKARF